MDCDSESCTQSECTLLKKTAILSADRKLEIINLFAIRGTDPLIIKYSSDPIGPDNLTAQKEALKRRPDKIICSWGIKVR